MKHILLPTDFSANAYNAISYALHFFKETEATFFLLNTYTPAAYQSGFMVDGYSALQLEEITKNNSLKQLDALEKKIEKDFHNSKHTFKKLSSFNLLVSEIIACIDKYKIELIVMGTQGATGAKEIFLGTQTMYTIEKVKCPVIAVPSGYTYETPKEILFATDYKLSKTNKYLALIKEICTQHIARLNLLNAYYGVPLDESQQSTKDFLDTYFKDNAHLFHMAIDLDVIDAVSSFQIKHKINFMIMIHNKHSFFENLLFKPVIKELVFHTQVPFLVIPSEARMNK
jgi:nucleotide-binding universal stress UspA family protein